MGKSLIIKGADFSANAISFPTDNLIELLSTAFNVGVGIQGPDKLGQISAENRASCFMVDISEIYYSGARTVKLQTNPDYLAVLILGKSNVSWNTYNEEGEPRDWLLGWGNGKYKGPISADSKMTLNIKRVDNAAIENSVTLSDVFASIKLL